MRMSCNGCRVLRKGCSENCSIRPCLQWIKTPDSQANATVFLAKFYGRAGLMNLINAGPDHLRPAIFRSLLYEACGRIVNPIYGSVGLLWSGQWQLCQNAVEAVLKGAPIVPISTEAAAATAGSHVPHPHVPQAKAYDIRHVTKVADDVDETSNSNNSKTNCTIKPTKTRAFKRAAKPKSNMALGTAALAHVASPDRGPSTSHGSSDVSHPDEATTTGTSAASEGNDVDERGNRCDGDGEVELELTLGFGIDHHHQQQQQSVQKRCSSGEVNGEGVCKMELGLI